MLNIVRIDFPFIEAPSKKKVRPALCLTNPRYKNRREK